MRKAQNLSFLIRTLPSVKESHPVGVQCTFMDLRTFPHTIGMEFHQSPKINFKIIFLSIGGYTADGLFLWLPTNFSVNQGAPEKSNEDVVTYVEPLLGAE